jgi:hypothetical protein
MALIHVPRPSKRSYDPNRPASDLLKMQIEHLHHAERRLPLRYRTDIYVNAIKTEGEAANYVREVTEAIHRAHEEAAAKRVARAPKRKRVIDIAAVADESRPHRSTASKKKSTPKRTTAAKSKAKSVRKK